MPGPVLQREAVYGAIAAEQYGLITRRQLTELGLSRAAIFRRIKAGALIEVLPGVWRLAGVPRSWHQRALAVHLWAGEVSVIAGVSAAALHKLDGFPQGKLIEVITPRSLKSPSPNLAVRRPSAFSVADRTTVARIPVTVCGRTLIDVAGTATEAQLELAFEDARRRRLVSVKEMKERIAHLPMNQPGRRNLVKLLCLSEGTRPTESTLEVKVLRLLRREGYPPPIRQEVLNDHGQFAGRVDLVYPDRRLIIEVDGYVPHEGRHDFDADRMRRNRLVGMGWAVMHATNEMLHGEDREGFLRDLFRLYNRSL